MSTQLKSGFFSNLRYDVPASIVVFLVAMPLCLGIAMASGAPLFSGIIAGFVGGIVVSLISKSPLGVSGPAAGLAVIVLNAITELAVFETFLMAVVLAGVFQIVLSFLKAGVIGYYFPSSVIKGMLSGIGIIIVLKQIPHAFGYDKDPEGDFAFKQIDGHNTFSELGYMLESITPAALIITVVSMIILILWEQPFMTRLNFTKLVKGPLVVVMAGIGLNLYFQSVDDLGLNSGQIVSIPVADSFLGFFQQFSTPDFTQIFNPEVLLVAATMAVVASLETLLCVEATDKLDPYKRVTPTNRELLAQGVGNVVSGLIGGLPITQVIVRSSANIQSGGRTKASAFFHGVILLIAAMTIPAVLNLIPLASLAAILFVVGYKLAKPVIFKQMYSAGLGQFIPFIVTIIGIVFTDLLRGIGIGLAVGVIHILWNLFKTPFYFDPDKHEDGKPITIELSQNVSFLHKASVLKTLAKLPDGVHVVIDASKTVSIHPDVIEIVEDFLKNAELRDIHVEVLGLDVMHKNKNPVEKLGQYVLDHPRTR